MFKGKNSKGQEFIDNFKNKKNQKIYDLINKHRNESNTEIAKTILKEETGIKLGWQDEDSKVNKD
jgi:hypothetical protein